jgi:SAM-dependent methyltransferase
MIAWPMVNRFAFDRQYYDRFYRDPDTRVATQESVDVLADFVCAYLIHIGQPVDYVIDLGCGLGFWEAGIRRHFPAATYIGVEFSEYLCEEHGWTPGSAVDFRSRRKADLLICQGVLQYLADADCARAIANFAKLARGALYLEALTARDWKVNVDQEVTDGSVHLRTGSWYRERLANNFTNCGGGVFLADKSPAALFELEQLE